MTTLKKIAYVQFAFYFFLFLLPQALCQVSVKDFGAKGDGKTDDTKAFEAAMNALRSSEINTNRLPNGINTSVYTGSIRHLIVPHGIYVISRSVKCGSYITIKGEDALLISSQKGGALAPYVAFDMLGWQTEISGLQIIGFSVAIRIDNKNSDIGKIYINDCSFSNNETAIDLNAQSSITIISNNRFVNNARTLNIRSGDKVMVESNWITAGKLKGSQPANIINYGILSFLDNLLVPLPVEKGTQEPAWINNYGSVTCERIRQGGEDGSFTLINNFAKAKINYPVIPNSIIVKNSDCYAAYRSDNNVQPAVIRLIEIPNQIVLEDIRGLVDAKLIGHSYLKVSDPSTWAGQYTAYPKLIKIRVANIIGGIEERTESPLPAYLKPLAEIDGYQLARTKKGVEEVTSSKETGGHKQDKGKLPKFEYEFQLNDISANYLISYTGNPNVNGSGSYSGGVVLLMRCNGAYRNGKVCYELSFTDIYNTLGGTAVMQEKNKYSVVWKSTNTTIKPVSDTDFTVRLVFDNSTSSERIKVINLNNIN